MKQVVSTILALLLMPTLALAQNTGACRATRINDRGSSGADVAVDNTSGGVTVMAALDARCGAIIVNTGTGTAAMRCAQSTLTVTSTVGFLLNPGDALVLGNESQQAWKCIRTTGSSTTANVIEAIPALVTAGAVVPPTATATATATPAPTNTPVPTNTPAPTFTPTATAAPTNTPAPTATFTPAPTATATP